ncbi:hypothetical protein L9F63_004078 [Diploptera punctata]|uniref:Craniofacial development protein 1 n=1 Tax=Diploptera punctata TaxID=6984 RepID=A0AAD7ZGK3_DIPPU|nr:hypothetical protein L9F63_004078 [Diploptera punctata]
MDERELLSDSDESDADYVPSGAESNPPSEEESEGEEENDQADSDADIEEKGKRKHKTSRGKKKKKMKTKRKNKAEVKEPELEREPSEEKEVLTEEEQKKKADSLWSDFLKDTGSSVNHSKPSITNGNTKELPALKSESQKSAQKENKVTITKVYEFAGEEVRVTAEVNADSAEARLSAKVPFASSAVAQGAGRGRGRGGGLKGLSSVLGQIGKKSKLGTLEKSKLDWDRYKQEEGLDEEIQLHNRGKDGYLEKQDFLQRTDLRQFEIEKELRTTRRSNR